MPDSGLLRSPHLDLPFRLRGYDGRVSVTYGVNRDVRNLGFHLVGIPFDPSLTHGFPVFQANTAYNGPGYHALMGWLQVVTVDATAPDRFAGASVDVPPIFWDADTPWAVFGHAPTLFDAPGPNPPRTDERWIAETFLAFCPDVIRTRRVRALLGIRWGYDLVSMRATPLPLEVITEADWRRCAVTLAEEYPTWEFAPTWVSSDATEE